MLKEEGRHHRRPHQPRHWSPLRAGSFREAGEVGDSPELWLTGYLLRPGTFPDEIYLNPNHSSVLTPLPLHQDMIQILLQTPPDQVMESKVL